MDIKRARIFVVEDENVMRNYVLTNLRRIGILDLYAFEDGSSALAEVAKLKPDLVITDIHMEPLGGLDFVRHMRSMSDERVNSIKVIFLSADSSAETVGEALPLGVAGYLVKPPSLNSLATKIEQALNR